MKRTKRLAKYQKFHQALKRNRKGLTWMQGYRASYYMNIADAVYKLRRKYGEDYILCRPVKDGKHSRWMINPEYR